MRSETKRTVLAPVAVSSAAADAGAASASAASTATVGMKRVTTGSCGWGRVSVQGTAACAAAGRAGVDLPESRETEHAEPP